MTTTTTKPTTIEQRIHQIESIIGTDVGGRGMASLIVPGDLLASARAWARLAATTMTTTNPPLPPLIVLSGFPCHIDCVPPTETDGPAGSVALCRAGVALGHRVVLVTDDCNETVFRAAMEKLMGLDDSNNHHKHMLSLHTFPPPRAAAAAAAANDDDDDAEDDAEEDDARWEQFRLAHCSDDDGACCIVVACERAGPARDGVCYTMRGVSMNHLVAPLHRLVAVLQPQPQNQHQQQRSLFVAIGDGGNELGMGKGIRAIEQHIPLGEKIGCVVAADYLIAASVSNWGGYALAAAVALARAELDPHYGKDANNGDAALVVLDWLDRCLPTEQDEVDLLDRCVNAGCRDGVTGKMEATVDGLSLEQNMQCLRDIRAAALGQWNNVSLATV